MLEKGMHCGYHSQGREQAAAFKRLRSPAEACAWMGKDCGTRAIKATEMPPATTKPLASQNQLPLSTGQQVRTQVHV